MTQFYPIIIALIFNATDLLSGLIAAIKNKEIQSSKLRDGLFKKVAFILCYFLAWLLDNGGTKVGFQIGVQILPIILLYVCTTEVVSIIENLCKINPDLVPEKLMSMFHFSEDTRSEK